MRFLRSNTAVMVTVGPFYDKTDGVTIETALTITNERITLTADTDAGSAPTNILDNVTGATSGTSNDLNYITGNDAGMMQLELAAADTNRVGRMLLSITDAANHVPVFHEFFVLPAAIYDWLTGVIVPLPANVTTWLGTAAATPTVAGVPEVDVTHFNGTAGTFSAGIPEVKVNNIAANAITATSINADAITAAKVAADVHQETIELAFTYDATATYATASAGSLVKEISDNAGGAGITSADLGIVDSGTAQSATATTLVLRSAAAFADDELIGATIVITGGTTGVGQSRVITDYTSSSPADTATVDTWTTTPTGTITYKVFASAPASATSLPSVNLVQVGGSTTNVAALATNVDAILTDTAVIGAAGAGLTALATQASVNTIDDFLDTEIAAIKAKTDNLPTDPADASDIAALVTAVDDLVDTEVAAIKAKTDQLIFTKTNELDVNIQSVNGTTVNGSGGSGTEWGP